MSDNKPLVVPAKTLPAKVTNIKEFQQVLEAYEPTVASLLGNRYGMTATEFNMTILNAVKKTPKLIECNTRSLFGAVLMSAELGLKINSPEGFAYLIPYGKEAQFQIGYKGLIEIALRSPMVKSIMGNAVYANEYYTEDEMTFKHIKYTGMDINRMAIRKHRTEEMKALMLDQADIDASNAQWEANFNKGKGALVLVYAAAYVEGKELPIFASVTKDVLVNIETNISKAGSSNSSPYKNGTDVHNFMQIKAAVKKLYKFLPKSGSAQMAKAIEYDDLQIIGGIPNIADDGTVEIISYETKVKEERKGKIESALGDLAKEENPE